jgi:hypothetical protein
MRFRRALRGGRSYRPACLSPLVYAFAAALTTFSSSQQPERATGQIIGIVTDSERAIVTGATIALESQLTHEQNTSKSDGYGNHFIHAFGLQDYSAVVLYGSSQKRNACERGYHMASAVNQLTLDLQA